MRAAVVTPTWNERENLPVLVERVLAVLPDATVVVVDDGSPDGTAELARGLGHGSRRVEVLERSGKTGLGSAYRAGLTFALERGFDPIFQMDADLSHDPVDCLRLAGAGSDLALGSRYVPGGSTRGWPAARLLLSKVGSVYARGILGLPYRDLTGGFKCWRAACLHAVDPASVRSEGYVFQVETTLRAHRMGFFVREIPIVFSERAHGASKLSPVIALEAAWRVPVLRVRA
jgi:dolichol-phosphate mannosyltransferase